MEKGIAITTVLLILVGTVVTGLTVYYTYRSVSGSPLSEHECRGMMVSWCTYCDNLDYQGGSSMGSQLSDCAGRYWGMGGHSNCNAAESDCSAFLPGGGGGTAGPSLCSELTENGYRRVLCWDRDDCTNSPPWSCAIESPTDCAPTECCCVLPH